jgi:hypothetical protein
VPHRPAEPGDQRGRTMTPTVFLVLLAGHLVGDWVIQTDGQAFQQDPLLGRPDHLHVQLPPTHGALLHLPVLDDGWGGPQCALDLDRVGGRPCGHRPALTVRALLRATASPRSTTIPVGPRLVAQPLQDQQGRAGRPGRSERGGHQGAPVHEGVLDHGRGQAGVMAATARTCPPLNEVPHAAIRSAYPPATRSGPAPSPCATPRRRRTARPGRSGRRGSPGSLRRGASPGPASWSSRPPSTPSRRR